MPGSGRMSNEFEHSRGFVSERDRPEPGEVCNESRAEGLCFRKNLMDDGELSPDSEDDMFESMSHCTLTGVGRRT